MYLGDWLHGQPLLAKIYLNDKVCFIKNLFLTQSIVNKGLRMNGKKSFDVSPLPNNGLRLLVMRC